MSARVEKLEEHNNVAVEKVLAAKSEMHFDILDEVNPPKVPLPAHLQKRLDDASAMPRTNVLERCDRADKNRHAVLHAKVEKVYSRNHKGMVVDNPEAYAFDVVDNSAKSLDSFAAPKMPKRMQKRLDDANAMPRRSVAERCTAAEANRDALMAAKVEKAHAHNADDVAKVQAAKREVHYEVLDEVNPAKVPLPAHLQQRLNDAKAMPRKSLAERCAAAEAKRDAFVASYAEKAHAHNVDDVAKVQAAKRDTHYEVLDEVNPSKVRLPAHLQQRLKDAKAMPRTGVVERCAKAEANRNAIMNERVQKLHSHNVEDVCNVNSAKSEISYEVLDEVNPVKVQLPARLQKRLDAAKAMPRTNVLERCASAQTKHESIMRAKVEKLQNHNTEALESVQLAKSEMHFDVLDEVNPAKVKLPPHLEKRLDNARAMPRTGVLERSARANANRNAILHEKVEKKYTRAITKMSLRLLAARTCLM